MAELSHSHTLPPGISGSGPFPASGLGLGISSAVQGLYSVTLGHAELVYLGFVFSFYFWIIHIVLILWLTYGISLKGLFLEVKPA